MKPTQLSRKRCLASHCCGQSHKLAITLAAEMLETTVDCNVVCHAFTQSGFVKPVSSRACYLAWIKTKEGTQQKSYFHFGSVLCTSFKHTEQDFEQDLVQP